MKLREIRPTLYSGDVKATIEFYTSKLNFACVHFDEGYDWAALKRDDIEINISAPHPQTEFLKPQLTGSIYIITIDVDTLWQEFKDKAQVCYPIENFFYGMREFAIYDNNGYLLQFGEEVVL